MNSVILHQWIGFAPNLHGLIRNSKRFHEFFPIILFKHHAWFVDLWAYGWARSKAKNKKLFKFLSHLWKAELWRARPLLSSVSAVRAHWARPHVNNRKIRKVENVWKTWNIWKVKNTFLDPNFGELPLMVQNQSENINKCTIFNLKNIKELYKPKFFTASCRCHKPEQWCC